MTSTTARCRSIARFSAAFAALALAACNQNTPPPAPIDLTKLTAIETNDIGKSPDLQQIAMTAGKDLYEKNCASCHGADLKGTPEQHTPDLTDDVWTFSGDDLNSGGLIMFPSDVEKTILVGIRAGNPKSRNDADMPGLGPKAKNILTDAEIADVAEYVLKLSGQMADEEAVKRADKIWNDKGSCYDCHDYQGIGNGSIGGPDLTKKEHFLYGADRQAIVQTITSGRHGVSPAFEGRLKPDEVKAIAVYVFSHAAKPPPLPTKTP